MKIKRILGDSIVYGFTSYLIVLAGIILTPLYTRIFTKEEYGIIDVFNTWNVFAGAILPLGLITAIIRFYPDIKDDSKDKRITLGTILTALCFMGAFYFILMILIKGVFINFIGANDIDEIYYHCVYIVLTGLFLAYSKVVLQAKFKKYKYTILSVTNFLILCLLGFGFVYFYHMRIVGFYRASSISMTISVILGAILIKDEIYFAFSKSVLKKLLKYSIHFISVFFLFQVINIIDRVILLNFTTLSDIGVYNIGTKISGIVNIMFMAFATAWFPLAMSIKDKPDAKETYKKVHNLYYVVSFFCLFALFLFRKELIYIFAPDYKSSYYVIGILALAYMVNGSVYLYALGIHITSKTKIFTISAILSVAINIIVSIGLVKVLKIDGVAWGTLLGGITWILVQTLLISKHYKIRFNYVLAIGTIIILSMLIYLMPFFDNIFIERSLTAIITIKSLVVILIGIIGYIFVRRSIRNVGSINEEE